MIESPEKAQQDKNQTQPNNGRHKNNNQLQYNDSLIYTQKDNWRILKLFWVYNMRK